MGFLISIITNVLANFVGNVLAEEYRTGVPAMADWLLRRAILALPTERRDEYLSEWRQLISELPSPTAKLTNAISLWWSAERIGISLTGMGITARSLRRTRAVDAVLSLVIIGCELPVYLVLTMLIRLVLRKRTAFKRRLCQGSGGESIALYEFDFGGTSDNRHQHLSDALNRMRLYKLPHFFNLLRGDIALVGVPAVRMGRRVPEAFAGLPVGMFRDFDVPIEQFCEDLRQNHGIRFMLRTMYRVVRASAREVWALIRKRR